jgi:hypothetical protein
LYFIDDDIANEEIEKEIFKFVDIIYEILESFDKNTG